MTGSPDTVVRLRFLDDNKGRRGPATEREGTVSELWPAAMRAQAEGYGVFYVINETERGLDGTAEDGDIVRVRAVAADFDNGLPWDYHAQPDLIVHTSAGKGQALWLNRDKSIRPEDFKAVSKRLIAYYGSDRAVQNASRVLRLPGTLHLKGEPQLVTFDAFDGDDVFDGLPELPPPEPASVAKGDPVPFDHLAKLLTYINPEDRTSWRDLVAAVRNTNSGTEEDRFGLLLEKIDPAWHEDAAIIWDTMPPKADGVGYGHLYHHASLAGYTGAPATQRASLRTTFKNIVNLPGAWYTAQETYDAEVQPLDELVAGLVEKGIVNFLTGAGAAGKSRLALQWMMTIDAGLPVFGRQTQKATGIYISCEDHPNEFRRRAKQIAAKLKLPVGTWEWRDMTGVPVPLAIVSETGIEETAELERLKEKLNSINGHKLVILDSTYDVLMFTGNAKVNEASVMAGIGLLSSICRDTNSTIITLWHPSQAGAERGDASGWSVAWRNKPRAIMLLEKMKDAEAWRLFVKKRNNAPCNPDHVMHTLHYDAGALVPMTDVAHDAHAAKVGDTILSVAILAADRGQAVSRTKAPPTWFPDEVELRCGTRPATAEIRDVLARAQRDGFLRYGSGPKDCPVGYYPLLWQADEGIETVPKETPDASDG